MTGEVKIIECPRDAMQGMERFIPTETKTAYINALLRVGFHTIDFGSFVSPKAIPQMADTARVLDGLDLSNTDTALLAIIANTRGAEDAARFPLIRFVGFPLSISETFQKRNTNKTIAEAMEMLKEIRNVSARADQKLVVYISMGFGNPYGDPYSAHVVSDYVGKLAELGADVISLADTVGAAQGDEVASLFTNVLRNFPDVELGAHLHARAADAREKVEAAWRGGCRRFDGALRGFGGCPMAHDELVGNVPTETIVSFLQEMGPLPRFDPAMFRQAMTLADEVFAGNSQ